MLKRMLFLLSLWAFASTAFAGCARQPPQEQPTPVPAATDPSAQQNADVKNAPSSAEAVLTLEQIKKAAGDAGYIVSEGYQYILMDDIVGGITVEIAADGAHTLYSIVECATEKAAVKNTGYIDGGGCSISLRNGRFFTSYDLENPGKQRKEILSSILVGAPLPAPPYPENARRSQSEGPAPPEGGHGRQEGRGCLADGSVYVTIIGMKKRAFEDGPGVVVAYELKNTSEDAMDAMGALCVKAEQNCAPLPRPSAYKPSYCVTTEIDPGESLRINEEYILRNEQDPVKIEIQESGSFSIANSSVVCKTFVLD